MSMKNGLKELKSSIRWTFEKMYEKMKSFLSYCECLLIAVSDFVFWAQTYKSFCFLPIFEKLSLLVC